jgi:hypothetical protein
MQSISASIMQVSVKRLQDGKTECSWKFSFQSQAHLNCWLNARRRNEPPDDSAGRFARRLYGNVKVAILSTPALHLPTLRPTS